MLFTDAGSLTYDIKTDDGYEDFYEDKCLFDFNNYPKYSKFCDTSSINEIGKMKDESKGNINDAFVGLKSKMHSLIDVDGKENKTAKVVNKHVVKNIRYNEFVGALFNRRVMRHRIKRIHSKLHRIGTYEVYKISLSCSNDKRYILDDGINSLAYFYKDVRGQ